MKKLIPLFVVILILSAAAYFILADNQKKAPKLEQTFNIEPFNKQLNCARLPTFLYKNGILRPIIDLSQLHYKGIAFYYGKNFSRVLHKKEWERFDALGTYTIDKRGNIYLTPNPFISIKPTTFNLQKAIYKMDSNSANLERWMVIDDVKPNANNPYGLISILYDCSDNTLWASAIDESNYKAQKGVIYHINPKNKDILEKIKNFDALTLAWLYTKKARYLLAGSARDNSVYAFAFKDKKIIKTPHKLFNLPNAQLRVRKIKVIGKNRLKIEAIKFNYSLIAQTDKKQRDIYIASYNPESKKWELVEK